MFENNLRNHIHQRFQEVFGKYDDALGLNGRWSIKPHPNAIAINIVVDGVSAQRPAIWVFDPHSGTEGVTRTIIESEHQVEEAIRSIQQRMEALRAMLDQQKAAQKNFA